MDRTTCLQILGLGAVDPLTGSWKSTLRAGLTCPDRTCLLMLLRHAILLDILLLVVVGRYGCRWGNVVIETAVLVEDHDKQDRFALFFQLMKPTVSADLSRSNCSFVRQSTIRFVSASWRYKASDYYGPRPPAESFPRPLRQSSTECASRPVSTVSPSHLPRTEGLLCREAPWWRPTQPKKENDHDRFRDV